MSLYPQVLNEKQDKLMEKLDFLKFPPFYLGGGTALAIQLGHRTSLDFDFYSQDKFDTKNLFGAIQTIGCTEDTVQVVVDGVDVSVFHYPYKLIDDLVEFRGIQMAGLNDISAMKMIAIVQRARQRDFVDMYYLVKLLGFKKILESVYKKYPWYAENEQILYKSLTYFEEADADLEADRIRILNPQVTWEKVKKELKDMVNHG